MISELRTELEEIYKDFLEICDFSETDIISQDVYDLLGRIEYLNEEITKIELLEENIINIDFFDEFLDQDIDLHQSGFDITIFDFTPTSELIEEVDWVKEGF